MYIQFYGVRHFHGRAQITMYSDHRKYDDQDGLAEDLGRKFGFQGIQTINHLCARAPGGGGNEGRKKDYSRLQRMQTMQRRRSKWKAGIAAPRYEGGDKVQVPDLARGSGEETDSESFFAV